MIELLDGLVTDAHDSWKRAIEDLVMLRFENTQLQGLGPMTFKAGSSGFLLEEKDEGRG